MYDQVEMWTIEVASLVNIVGFFKENRSSCCHSWDANAGVVLSTSIAPKTVHLVLDECTLPL